MRKSKQGMWIGPLALLMAFGFSVPAANAATGTATVSISPSTATIAAGGSEAYTLSVTCRVTGDHQHRQRLNSLIRSTAYIGEARRMLSCL